VAVDRTVQNNRDVWLLDRGVSTRFTFDASVDSYPIWSRDGRSIVFRSNRKGVYDLFQKPSSSAGSETVLLESPDTKFPSDWSPDGRFLLYQNTDPKTNNDLWILPVNDALRPSTSAGQPGDRKPFPFVQTVFDESQGQFSPDGHWIAYQSNESGRIEIYVQPFPGPGGKWQVSTAGGAAPRWRRDGQELFYLAPDSKLMAVPIHAQAATFEYGAPVALFQTRVAASATSSFRPQYTVAADGRFLINVTAEESTVSPITVVLNWKR
jgi:Tol biopolymer transport system component